ncbi:hypothetical protein N7519_009090 [Penicillium mononematosum]|uniref:uncharacterized protein n=1 Tax=Penicillium mononematosum TaxID=268346 RepID=UPI0025488DFB|nr:uncharacterized protein N7519_009090 [Penicillium mononematosum]KAJ6178629.1 hypothetical protein N7519_009090 [Penicillium mononematosum]
MALHLIPIARFLESVKLLFVIAESSMSPPTFKRSASSTGFKFPGLWDPNAAACSLNNTPLIGSQALQAHDTLGPCSDPACHHVHSLFPPMPLGMIQQVAVLVVRDVLREREQIVSVSSSQSLYYHSAARIHRNPPTHFPYCPLWMEWLMRSFVYASSVWWSYIIWRSHRTVLKVIPSRDN